MAMTFLCVHQTQGGDKSTLRLLVSNEYTPTKDRDAEGKVLPNQEWQHPDPLTLRYTEMGVGLSGPGPHFTSPIQTMMEHGVKCFGGHARLITDGAEDILKGDSKAGTKNWPKIKNSVRLRRLNDTVKWKSSAKKVRRFLSIAPDAAAGEKSARITCTVVIESAWNVAAALGMCDCVIV
jgi:hypothetical protein